VAALAAHLEAPRWGPAAGLAAIAAGVGLLAGLDPLVAIAVVLGLAFLLIAFADLTAALVIFILIMFLEGFPLAGPALSFAKLAGIFLALSWLARVATRDEGHRGTFLSAHPGASYLLLLFIAWTALSLLWAESIDAGLLSLARYALNATLFVIVFTAVQTRRQAGWVVAIYILGAVVTSMYGLVARPTADPEAFRLESTVGNANQFAAVLVVGIILAAGVALALRRPPAIRILAVGMAALMMSSFVLTGSRSGVIALGCALVAAVVFSGRWRLQAALGALALALCAVTFFGAFAPAETRERIAQTAPGQVDATTEGRLTVWQVGWRMVGDKPVTGVGAGNFRETSRDYVLEPGHTARTDQVIDTPEVAHNTYLEALAELGVVGGLLFLGILAFSIGSGLVAARNFAASEDREMEIMTRALIAALIGFLAAAFFASEEFSKHLWLLLALGPSLLAISRAPRASDHA
jgi:putative inorganic carbon (hco3(-)) transporter